MKTRFEVGQVVESTVDSQGLRKGGLYEVVDLEVKGSFLGGFTTYFVRPLGLDLLGCGRMPVSNGHLLLKETEPR